MGCGDAAGLVDEQRNRQGLIGAVLHSKIVRADHHTVGDLFVPNERLDQLPALRVQRDAQHDETTVTIRLLKFD